MADPQTQAPPLDDVYNAIRAAHAQKDGASVRLLTQYLESVQTQPQAPAQAPEVSPGWWGTINQELGKFGRGVNQSLGALADTLVGTPAAVIARSLGGDMQDNPVQSRLARIGWAPEVGGQDEGITASAGRMTGHAVPFGAGFIKATTPLATKAPEAINVMRKVAERLGGGPVAQKTGEVAGALHNTARTMGESVLAHPARTGAAEVLGAAGAGAGGEVASKMYPNSPHARPWGELIFGAGAGVLPQLTPTGFITRYGKGGLEWLRSAGRDAADALAANPLAQKNLPSRLKADAESISRGEAKARARGGARMQRAARNPKEALARMAEADEQGGTGISLTETMKSQDEGLLQLEKDVINSHADLRGQYDERITRIAADIEKSVKLLVRGEGDVQDTRGLLEARRQYLNELMETRLRIATQKADERIAKLGVRATREDVNRIGHEELTNAMKAARAQERNLHGKVYKTDEGKLIAVTVESSENKFVKLFRDLPSAKKHHMPQVAIDYLKKVKPKPKKPGEDPGPAVSRLSKKPTFKEVSGVRSELLAVARAARADSQWDKARLADDLADVLLKDLGAMAGKVKGEAGQRLRTALDFSTDLNNRFTRGEVGRVLGYESSGGTRVAPGMLYERAGHLSGARGREIHDALIKAVDEMGPDIPGNTAPMRASIEDYIKTLFHREAVHDGQIVQSKAAGFMRDYDEVFSRLPELRKSFEEAITTGRAAEWAAQRQARVSSNLGKHEMSNTAVFLGKEPGGEIHRAVNSSKPSAVARELVRASKKDPSGKALIGLRHGTVEHIMAGSRMKPTEQMAEGYISGQKMLTMMNEPKMAAFMKEVMTGPQRARLKIIANEARKAERSILAKGTKEGVMGPGGLSKGLERIARIAVVHVTNRISKLTGAGGTVQIPGMASNAAKEAFQKAGIDPAQRVITDAVMYDPKLFRALLTLASPKTKPDMKAAKVAFKRIHAWAGGIVQEMGLEAMAPEEEQF